MCQHTGASLSYFGHLLKVDNMINYFPNNLQVEIVQVKVKHSKKVNRELGSVQLFLERDIL